MFVHVLILCMCVQVAGGSSHMLVLAMPRRPEVEEVVIEEDDVTETILETYTELLLMDPSLLMSNPPTAPPLWTLSARARRRERVSTGPQHQNVSERRTGVLITRSDRVVVFGCLH